MDDKERLALLEDAIGQVKISHKRMLVSIQHASDVSSGGNYSPELKHSIATQEMLEAI